VYSQQVLENFDVPEGHRLLNRAHNPMCTMGYAVTSLGAQRLLYRTSVVGIESPVDYEISKACIKKEIRCLEVNPPLFGQYHHGGPAGKVSDNEDDSEYNPNISRGKVNPMGRKSVKSMLESILGPLVPNS
jgi:hypothetical protein